MSLLEIEFIFAIEVPAGTVLISLKFPTHVQTDLV